MQPDFLKRSLVLGAAGLAGYVAAGILIAIFAPQRGVELIPDPTRPDAIIHLDQDSSLFDWRIDARIALNTYDWVSSRTAGDAAWSLLVVCLACGATHWSLLYLVARSDRGARAVSRLGLQGVANRELTAIATLSAVLTGCAFFPAIYELRRLWGQPDIEFLPLYGTGIWLGSMAGAIGTAASILTVLSWGDSGLVRCWGCGYALTGLPDTRCPECALVNVPSPPMMWARWVRYFLFGFLVLLGTSALAIRPGQAWAFSRQRNQRLASYAAALPSVRWQVYPAGQPDACFRVTFDRVERDSSGFLVHCRVSVLDPATGNVAATEGAVSDAGSNSPLRVTCANARVDVFRWPAHPGFVMLQMPGKWDFVNEAGWHPADGAAP